MIFEKRLTKENQSAWYTRTIALEAWPGDYWKYRVTVWKDKVPKDKSVPEPDIKTYGFTNEEEAKTFARTQVSTAQRYGYA
jgi:hypothetical protein